jgi:hypothetical protein
VSLLVLVPGLRLAVFSDGSKLVFGSPSRRGTSLAFLFLLVFLLLLAVRQLRLWLRLRLRLAVFSDGSNLVFGSPSRRGTPLGSLLLFLLLASAESVLTAVGQRRGHSDAPEGGGRWPDVELDEKLGDHRDCETHPHQDSGVDTSHRT